MSAISDPAVQSLLDRLSALKAKLAQLESRLADELPEVPWHVFGRRSRRRYAARPHHRHLPRSRRPARTPMNFWHMGSRFDHFKSHSIR